MNTHIPKAEFGGVLEIADIEIECAVLPDETRVLSRIDFLRAIGRKGKAKGGRKYDSGFKIPVFLTANNLQPLISDDLKNHSDPIQFLTPNGGKSIGYKAELLPGVCTLYIDAQEAGVLRFNQEHIAKRCKILIRGLAVVGINGLVDEATGYQGFRAKNALAKILDRYIEQEKYRAWTKTFPDEFYRRMFELKEWPTNDPRTLKRPSIVGKYTNDIIYERLAPGVLEELKRVNPTDEKGHRKQRHHQWLTGDIGHPRLKEHLIGIIALMNAAPSWDSFQRMLQRAYPKPNTTMLLDLPEEY